ncbi:MAG: single-stranded DNA-binding protein [Planctomycetota bacterium]|jgi:single-strand DNA-binding protein|nr:single-stranded DNA-binding protein [Planctomycetota bacterium]
MASFNKVILMGNLTRDPEVRQSQNGTAIVRAGLAVNERRPDGNGGWKEQAHFFDITIFGSRGEAFARFNKRGACVLVEGRLNFSQWQDKESGQNRSKVDVVVDNWNFTGSKASEGGPAANNESQEPPVFPGPDSFGNSAGGMSDDVPF